MTPATWISLSALGGAGLVAVVLAGQHRDLARRLEALEDAPAPAARADPAPGGPALTGEGALATRRELELLEQRVVALTKRAEPALAAVATGGVGGPGVAAALDQRVEAAVAKGLESEEFRRRMAEAAQAAGKPGIEKKPTFAALASYLALDAAQEGDFRRDLEDTQGALFALLAERRPDGRVLLEEIGVAEGLPEGDPKRMQVFLEMFQLKIPGTEETYVARAVALALDFRKRTAAYLKPEQLERFGAADVDLFGVKMN